MPGTVSEQSHRFGKDKMRMQRVGLLLHATILADFLSWLITLYTHRPSNMPL